jgi:hypothetical protein
MLVYLLCHHLEEERLNTAATIRRARIPTNLPREVPVIIPGRFPEMCQSAQAEESFVMMFAKRLREGVRHGEITCSVRFWMRPHVTVGARYRMESGEIEVDSIETIGFPDITPMLARESGFLGVLDLLKIAKHGKGENIYLVRFHYVPPPKAKRSGVKSKSRVAKT